MFKNVRLFNARAPYARIHAMIDQCYFSIHLSATWTGNHRNTSVIFSYNPRISPALRTMYGVTRSYSVLCALGTRYVHMN